MRRSILPSNAPGSSFSAQIRSLLTHSRTSIGQWCADRFAGHARDIQEIAFAKGIPYIPADRKDRS